jgi:hypothetical protein
MTPINRTQHLTVSLSNRRLTGISARTFSADTGHEGSYASQKRSRPVQTKE